MSECKMSNYEYCVLAEADNGLHIDWSLEGTFKIEQQAIQHAKYLVDVGEYSNVVVFHMKEIARFEEKGTVKELNNLSTCSKCHVTEETADLIWITSKDYAPNEEEFMPEEVLAKYTALCFDCYYSEVKCKRHSKYRGIRFPTVDCEVCRKIYIGKKVSGD